MANVTVKGTLKELTAYLPNGDEVSAALDVVMNALTPAERLADNLGLYVFEDISTTKQEIDDDAGAKPILFIARSGGTLCYIHFHNADADSVTAGVDANFVVPVGGTAGEITWVAAGGKSWDTFWDTGLTVSASTTVEASAAPTNTPDIFVLYLGS